MDEQFLNQVRKRHAQINVETHRRTEHEYRMPGTSGEEKG